MRLGRREWVLVALVVLLGTAVRAYRAYGPPLWVDEAESTINALTILDHGVPVDHYLGMPIFENVLIREFPESAEYAFKDVSYSDKGLAIYHGWLPLYVMAATCRIGRILPDDNDGTLRVQHPESSFLYRSFVPRLPAIIAAIPLLLLTFALARRILGPDAGWPALIAVAFLDRFVYFGVQARYYSLTLLFSALCAYAIWQTANRRRWRDFVLLGVAFVALFHTHTLSFLILSTVGALMLRWIVREPADIARLGAAAFIVFAGTLPWLILTGYLDSTAGIPRAWTQMAPVFALYYPMTKKVFLIPAVLGILWLLAAEVFEKRLPSRLTAPFTQRTLAFYFLTAWTGIAYAAFTLLIPAASYFLARVSLVVALPGLLLTVAVAIAAAEVVSRKHVATIATAGLVILMVGSNRITPRGVEAGQGRFLVYDLIRVLRDIEFRPGTKLYATPNNHLLLTYYAGLPVQSVAPIRKSFFDSYEGDILVFETIALNGPMMPLQEAMKIGKEFGAPINEANVERWIDAMDIWNTAQVASQRVNIVRPTSVKSPEPLRALLDVQQHYTKAGLEKHQREIPMLHDQAMQTWADWWTCFFYRFVNVEEHTGPNLNFANRMRGGVATVLPYSWVIYESTPTGPPYVDMRKAYRIYERSDLLPFFNADRIVDRDAVLERSEDARHVHSEGESFS